MYDGVDIFTSRRTNFNECTYWCRTKDDIKRDIDLTTMVFIDTDLNEISYERIPNGTFYAKEVNEYSSNNNIVAGAFMFDENVVMLETADNIEELKQNDIVAYDGNVWRVTSIGKMKKTRQNQFSRTPAYITYISLRR